MIDNPVLGVQQFCHEHGNAHKIMTKTETNGGALAGIRVLDLTRILAGPTATQILGDLGAEVLKIERPGSGDDTRHWGPPYHESPSGEPLAAAYFLSCNRSKRSVAIDMATAEGQELLQKLAVECDVLIENFRVGGLEKYGLDYESIRAKRPDIIYCSITGFGQSGPYKARAGYDFMIQAMGGLMSVTGQPDGAPGGEPVKVGVALADLLTGLYAVIGIQAALRHRERTGEGQMIDLALFDVQAASLANQALNYLTSGHPPGRLGNAHPNIVPYQVFRTADGHMVLAAGNDRQFAAFCDVAGCPELAGDARFATNPQRVINRDELVPVLADIIAAQPLDWWLEKLGEAAVPAGPINTLDRVFADPQIKHRGMQLMMEMDAGSIPGVASPLNLPASPVRYTPPPLEVGAHTDEVLSEVLGLDKSAIAALRTGGAVG